MPPPDSGVPPLNDEDKMQIARWIDLGCPIDLGFETGNEEFGWHLDEQRPCLTMTVPHANRNRKPLTRICFATTDGYTGVNKSSIRMTASFPVNGRQPGVELGDLVRFVSDGRFELVLDRPVYRIAEAHIHLSVRDNQGNTTRIDRRFSIQPPPQSRKSPTQIPPTWTR